ncbi:MAG TPA: site-specific integrase [Ktedonobacterales bacterium]|nr:site-specific integrase [Ktedonobacterales bacterium]
MQFFTPAQARIFLQGIHGEPLEAFYVLALNTGMRCGEILALHWANVHLDATLPHLEVKFTLQDEQGGRFAFAPPKTRSGRRYIPLNQTVMGALRAHRIRQEAQRQVAKSVSVWQEEDLVFTTAIGGPLRGNHILQRQFEPLCRRLGLPRIRLHDLRHTAATLMLANHQPTEFVSKVLGHSTPSITSDIYLHVTTPMTYEAVSSLDQLFVDVSTAPPSPIVGDVSTAAHDGANPTGHANAHDLPPA